VGRDSRVTLQALGVVVRVLVGHAGHPVSHDDAWVGGHHAVGGDVGETRVMHLGVVVRLLVP